jgi:hypothetical protein
MNNLEDTNYINRLYDELNSCRNTLMNDLKNDKECTKERILNQKIMCVDNLMKNILKYRNINTKEKLKGDL